MAAALSHRPSAVAGPSELGQRLAALIARLAGPRQEIEAAFLAVGEELGGASSLLDRIVAAFEALPRDLDGAEMQEAAGRLGRFTGRAHEIAAAFARERGDVHKLLAAVDAATDPVEDLHRSVRLMGILSVNARIVAAGLADAADQFDVFTTDIAELSKSATAAVVAFAHGHTGLAAAVAACVALVLVNRPRVDQEVTIPLASAPTPQAQRPTQPSNPEAARPAPLQPAFAGLVRPNGVPPASFAADRASFDWMNRVQFQQVPLEQLRFSTQPVLQSEDLSLRSRRPFQGQVEMTAFRYQK